MSPKNAIIAVTLNCNSRCIMCDIWKNKIKDELLPQEYLKLPSSLEDINITGGEPFLRRDLVDIIRNMKQAAPRTRFVMNSNGFMPHRAAEDLPKIVKIDPKFAFRVSIDGMGEAHDAIRRIPGGFNKIIKTLTIARESGIQDLGVSFTVLDQNIDEIDKVRSFCEKEKLQFSLTVATSSVIYFGTGKESLRPKISAKLHRALSVVAQKHYIHLTPKEIVRGWFVKRLLSYVSSHKRALPCDAGKGFFYLDSIGNVYTCHLKPWILGNIKEKAFSDIFANHKYDAQVAACNSCWMVCTAKSMMKKRLAFLVPGIASDVLDIALKRSGEISSN